VGPRWYGILGCSHGPQVVRYPRWLAPPGAHPPMVCSYLQGRISAYLHIFIVFFIFEVHLNMPFSFLFV